WSLNEKGNRRGAEDAEKCAEKIILLFSLGVFLGVSATRRLHLLHDLFEYVRALDAGFGHEQGQLSPRVFRDVEIAGLQILHDVQRVAELAEAVDAGDGFGDVSVGAGR